MTGCTALVAVFDRRIPLAVMPSGGAALVRRRTGPCPTGAGGVVGGPGRVR